MSHAAHAVFAPPFLPPPRGAARGHAGLGGAARPRRPASAADHGGRCGDAASGAEGAGGGAGERCGGHRPGDGGDRAGAALRDGGGGQRGACTLCAHGRDAGGGQLHVSGERRGRAVAGGGGDAGVFGLAADRQSGAQCPRGTADDSGAVGGRVSQLSHDGQSGLHRDSAG